MFDFRCTNTLVSRIIGEDSTNGRGVMETYDKVLIHKVGQHVTQL